jgi:lipopolysaccharide export system ATP-binding protein
MVDGKLFKSGTAEELANDPQVRKVYLGQNFELRKARITTQENYL